MTDIRNMLKLCTGEDEKRRALQILKAVEGLTIHEAQELLNGCREAITLAEIHYDNIAEERKRREKEIMSEKGKKILEAFEKAIPNMSEMEKEKLLAFGEGLACMVGLRRTDSRAEQD